MLTMTDERWAQAVSQAASHKKGCTFLAEQPDLADRFVEMVDYAKELRAASKRFQRVCGCGWIVVGAADFPCINCGSTEGTLLSIAYLELRAENALLKSAFDEVTGAERPIDAIKKIGALVDERNELRATNETFRRTIMQKSDPTVSF